MGQSIGKSTEGGKGYGTLRSNESFVGLALLQPDAKANAHREDTKNREDKKHNEQVVDLGGLSSKRRDGDSRGGATRADSRGAGGRHLRKQSEGFVGREDAVDKIEKGLPEAVCLG